MIAHDDSITATLNCQPGIFRREHTLDPNLHLRSLPQPRNIPGPRVGVVIEAGKALVMRLQAPALTGPLDIRKAQMRRDTEVIAPLVVADAEDGRVAGEEHGAAARVLGAPHHPLHQRAVAHRVYLHCGVERL